MSNKKGFYVGWQNDMPKDSSKAIRKLLIPLFVGIPVLAFLLIAFIKPFNDFVFEFGNEKTYTGRYYSLPFPMLILDEGQAPEGYDNYAMLVAYGKFGAYGAIEGHAAKAHMDDGKRVEMQGTLIYGDGQTLIELSDNFMSTRKVLDHKDKVFFSRKKKINTQLVGEVIDPKCWFGVMKPGEGKVHKSCAIRCISGGIPAVLRVPTERGNDYYILRDTSGFADMNDEILPYVAEQVAISGKSYTVSNWKVLHIEMADVSLVE